MAAGETSPHESSSPKLKPKRNPTAFRRRLLDKRPVSSHRRTIQKDKNANLKEPTICFFPLNFSEASSSKEGCSSTQNRELEELMRLSLPSFWMQMLKSHVSGGYWLGLTKQAKAFCATHLPKEDGTVTLVAEGTEHQVKYFTDRIAFSGGWKAFAKYHKLEMDDELFFELIGPSRLKVEIMRNYGPHFSED